MLTVSVDRSVADAHHLWFSHLTIRPGSRRRHVAARPALTPTKIDNNGENVSVLRRCPQNILRLSASGCLLDLIPPADDTSICLLPRTLLDTTWVSRQRCIY